MSYQYEHVLSFRVVDGDTVELELDVGFHCRYKFPFRLMGINAPEGKNTEAAGWLRSNLIAAELVVVTHKPDKYGRWLATIYRDFEKWTQRISVSDELVALGYAVPYDGGKRE